jgi:hypothetical protein
LTSDKRRGTPSYNPSEPKTEKRTTESFEILRETEREKCVVGGGENRRFEVTDDPNSKNKVPELDGLPKGQLRANCWELQY